MVMRETAVEALFTRLQTVAAFQSATRRNRAPENFVGGAAPALVLVEHSEDYKRPAINLPPVRTLLLIAMIYCDASANQNAIPGAAFNTILDAIDAALKPDDMMRGTCTLGGLVQSVMIDGIIRRSPGDITGKGVALIPLKMLLP